MTILIDLWVAATGFCEGCWEGIAWYVDLEVTTKLDVSGVLLVKMTEEGDTDAEFCPTNLLCSVKKNANMAAREVCLR
jgi:hypothetical protein